MSAAPIIEVAGLGKRYRLGHAEESADTLVGSVTVWLRSPLERFRRLRDLTRFANGADSPDTLWALRDVSFEVREGEVLGIIGRNGAGKSTLLKILSRITPPSTGRVLLRGAVASLLEVGTGFHPELSGRENVYLNGTLLGMSRRQIDAQLDAIVDFAGVGPFLDTPIKRYSSGMQVRLAFSVAAHLDADILIVDEVLAVGDVDFQKKCLGRMGQLARSGRTVLFVSHNMAAVQGLCRRCLVIGAGRLQFDGPVDTAIQHYFDEYVTLSAGRWHHRHKPSRLRLDRARLLVAGAECSTVLSGQEATIELTFVALPAYREPARVGPATLGVSLTLFRDGVLLSNLWTRYFPSLRIMPRDRIVLTCRIHKWPFCTGRFSLDVFSHWDQTIEEWVESALAFDSIDGDFFGSGHIPASATGLMFVRHSWEVECGSQSQSPLR